MGVWDADFNAVRREHEEFKKDPARVAQFVKYALDNGYFIGLEQARLKKVVGPALFAHEYRRYFDILLGTIDEAEKEIAHLQLALGQLKAVARQGRDRRSIDRLGSAPDDTNFQNALHAFQGWVVSFYETYLTLYGFVMGANNAQEKIRQLASAGWALMEQRKADNSMGSKHAELFKEAIET